MLRCDLAPRAWVRRSPGYSPVVVQLDAVWDPGGSALRSSLARSPRGLRPHGKDQHVPNIRWFSGLWVRFRATPFTSLRSLVLLPAFAFSRYATERLTRPYSGGLTRLRRAPSRQATIARLPHTASADLREDFVMRESSTNHGGPPRWGEDSGFRRAKSKEGVGLERSAERRLDVVGGPVQLVPTWCQNYSDLAATTETTVNAFSSLSCQLVSVGARWSSPEHDS